MRTLPRRVALLLCLNLASLCALAEVATPEQRAQAYFEALQSGGLPSVTRFLHPAERTRFRDLLLPVYQSEADAGRDDLMAATFGREMTMAQLRTLDPSEFCTQFLGAIGGSMAGVVSFESLQVLGTIPEGEKRHVVARIKVGAAPLTVTSMDVLTLELHEGQWMIMLNSQLEGMAAMLSANLAFASGAAEAALEEAAPATTAEPEG
jgi:hypothetical protein